LFPRALFLVLAACQTTPTEAPPTPAGDPLEASVTLDAERYVAQANTIRCIAAPCPSNAVAPVIKATITLKNTSDAPQDIELTSGQRFDLQVVDEAGTIVQTWSADKMFMLATSTVTLAPGQVETFDAELPFVPDLAGEFTLNATLLGTDETASVPLHVDLAGM